MARLRIKPKIKGKVPLLGKLVTANWHNGRITSYSVRIGRFRWNSSTRVLGWDHPGRGTTDLVADCGPHIGPQRGKARR